MDFLKYDLGFLYSGDVVEVSLDSAANVSILDSINFQYYKSGISHRYIGGYITKSPYRAQIPSSGYWYVCIDLGGYGGSVRSSVKVYPADEMLVKEKCVVLKDKTMIYYDEYTNGNVVLKGVVRDGINRLHRNLEFDSLESCIAYCYRINWSNN